MQTHLLAANLALLGLLVGGNFVLLPIHSCLICISTLIVYLGSHRSLISSQTSGKDSKMEYMQRKDAYMFPVMAGVTLVGLFCLFKFLDKDLVNLCITVYISIVSVFVIGNECEPLIFALALKNPDPVLEIKHWYWEEEVVATEEENKQETDNSWFFMVFGFHLPTGWGTSNKKEKKFKRSSTTYPIRQSLLASLLVGVIVTAWYVYTRHWVANNLIGAALSLQAIESLSLGTFQNGAYLLVFLFFYDIFFVFGTDVMVTVAKSVDAPIKLVFLKQFAQSDSDALFSMLGLGDIVLPGVFVALLLRFDFFRSFQEKRFQTSPDEFFPKNVFNIAIAMYALGLWCTVFVMHWFKHAQPALLYLVPAVLLASLLGGLGNRCLVELWKFEETPPPSPVLAVEGEEDKKKN
ncbi:hypothetical protein BASA81_008343 [Batrachochytrium salamandrivorans]|nr:hypothetical protein BASA81_008343 [Batrachochytrium salamandrivorans]